MRPSSFGLGIFFAGTVVLSGILAAAGCTVLTNDSLPDDAGTFEGGGDAATSVCASCLADQCTGQWAACLGDRTCFEQQLCSSGRGTCTCSWTNASDADGGADGGGDASVVDPRDLHAAFAACNAERVRAGGSCATDCSGDPKPPEKDPCSATDGGTDSEASDAGDAGSDGATDAGDDASTSSDASTSGDAGDAGTTPAGPTVETCTSCISGKCGDAKKACAIGTECAAYLECLYGAADVAAADECGRQHGTGKTAAAELATCTRVGCSEACGF